VPDLDFEIQGVEVARFAAAPLLNFKLRVRNSEPGEPVHSLSLQAQIRIETARRKYADAEQRRLLDIFGEPERWAQTLHSMLWTHTQVVVPGFTETVVADLPAPCTFDFNVAAAKYFGGLEGGEVPLTFLYSGTIFYEAADCSLRIAQISWSKESTYSLPVSVWKEMMDVYYPNTAWLCLRRDVFERLHQYKIDRGIPTWEQTVESMLP
jgi:hypothetical protein